MSYFFYGHDHAELVQQMALPSLQPTHAPIAGRFGTDVDVAQGASGATR
jgi:hypothetical protein